MTPGSPDFSLRRVDFDDLPGWKEDDPAALFEGMRNCLAHIRSVKPYRTGSLGLTSDDMLAAYQAAPQGQIAPDVARAFFERNFQPFLIHRNHGMPGFVTGFYEPEVDVSDTPSDEWAFPFYRRPDDLIDLDDTNRPGSLDPSYMFGRRKDDGTLGEYPDRKAIDRGYLAGRGLEIAWARSRQDVFFTHVQGAARLRFRNGQVRRITYAAKAGHPFSAIGKLLIERGEIDPAAVSMQTIRAWLTDNPKKVDEVLWHNRSYIFFKEADVGDDRLGPVAAAKVPLLPGRSLAVDRLIHTFGFPFFVHAPTLTHLDAGKPFGRTMLALDTGSAIVGPARGDIFTGSGDVAGEMAGTVRNEADFYILVPQDAAARFSA